MSNQYTITIENNSGLYKIYSLFTGEPKVTGAVEAKIWGNVCAIAPTAPGDVAKFTIIKQYVAMQGTSSGSPMSGVTVDVVGRKAVILGFEKPDHTVEPGSSVKLISADIEGPTGKIKVPSFDQKYLSPAGVANAFEIQTATTFTPDDAKQGNWLIGVGASVNGTTGPAAMFTPIPGQSYQVKPINVFYLSTGQYVPGTLVDYTIVANSPAKLDFSATGAKPDVTVNNTADGQFVVIT